MEIDIIRIDQSKTLDKLRGLGITVTLSSSLDHWMAARRLALLCRQNNVEPVYKGN